MAMSDFEHKKRYNQLLNDWKGVTEPDPTEDPDVFVREPSVRRENSHGAAPTPPRPHPQPPPQTYAPVPVRPAAVPLSNILFAPGAILWIDRQLMGIYKAAVPGRGFHLMLILSPGGVVRTQGVELERHEVEEVGVLPQAHFEHLAGTMSWDRDLIVFHCYSYEDTVKVPPMEHHVIHGGAGHAVHAAPAAAPEPAHVPAATPAPAPPPERHAEPEPEPPTAQSHHVHIAPPASGGLHRGQRLQFVIGDKTWQAVYWGKDDAGHVIAHKTYEDWDLMHMDLDRYSNSLKSDPEPDHALVKSIEDSLRKS